LDLVREIGDRGGEGEALNGIAEVLQAVGRPAEARDRHDAALALASQTGDRYEQARAHAGIAKTYWAVGAHPDALRHWEHALHTYTDLGVPEAAEVRARLAGLDPAYAAGAALTTSL
jgi:tetratricopeptide (TPR) repeat protein